MESFKKCGSGALKDRADGGLIVWARSSVLCEQSIVAAWWDDADLDNLRRIVGALRTSSSLNSSSLNSARASKETCLEEDLRQSV